MSEEKAAENDGKTERERELEARLLAAVSLGKKGYSAGLRDGAIRGYSIAIAMVEAFAKPRGMALGRPVPIGLAISQIAQSLREARPRIFRDEPAGLEDPSPEVTP